MTIYDVNKLLSSRNKSRLITHFWSCTCSDHDANHMRQGIDISEPNMAKHLSALIKYGVLDVKRVSGERFYSINPEFREKWKVIIEPQINSKENYEFKCSCSSQQ